MFTETCIFHIQVQNAAARNILTRKQHNPSLDHSFAYLNLQIDLEWWNGSGKTRKKLIVF